MQQESSPISKQNPAKLSNKVPFIIKFKSDSCLRQGDLRRTCYKSACHRKRAGLQPRPEVTGCAEPVLSWSKAHRRSNRRDQAHHRRHRGGQDRRRDNSKGGCVTHGRSTQPGVLVCAVRSQTAVGGPVSPWEFRVADCLKDSIWTTGQRCPSHDPFRTGRGFVPHHRKPRHG